MKYRITILVEGPDDPSATLDDLEHAIGCGAWPDTVRIDPDAEDRGEAVTVERLED